MTPIDVTTLSPAAQRLVHASAPAKMQELAARGVAPGIKPGEMIAVLLVLRASELPVLRDAAERTLAALPEPLLLGAIAADLPAPCIDVIARSSTDRLDVLAKLLAMPAADPGTVEDLARGATEELAELIATNEERLLKHPRIIELLYMNRRTRMSTADRLIELAARHGMELTGIGAWQEAKQAVRMELIQEPSAAPTPDDIAFREADELSQQLATAEAEEIFVPGDAGAEVVKDRFLPLYLRLGNMTVSQKIRRAMLGSKEERQLLVRDRNKIVASAAVRSPLLQEPDAILISRSRSVGEDVLRILATAPEWARSYPLKRNLCENPKTPTMLATRLIVHLREADVKALAKSKNVPGPVADAARRHLARRTS